MTSAGGWTPRITYVRGASIMHHSYWLCLSETEMIFMSGTTFY